MGQFQRPTSCSRKPAVAMDTWPLCPCEEDRKFSWSTLTPCEMVSPFWVVECLFITQPLRKAGFCTSSLFTTYKIKDLKRQKTRLPFLHARCTNHSHLDLIRHSVDVLLIYSRLVENECFIRPLQLPDSRGLLPSAKCCGVLTCCNDASKESDVKDVWYVGRFHSK